MQLPKNFRMLHLPKHESKEKACLPPDFLYIL